MKLIIQIPCLNEAETLEITLKSLPKKVEGFDSVEILVVDDGSTDNTSEIAKKNGVQHIIRHTHNMGLAKAFMSGIEAALNAGADVIVNTDADNQYNADDIPLLTAPILAGSADIIVGARPIATIRHFSPAKKLLQRIGSTVVRVFSKTDIPDAPSGFRAYNRCAAQQVMVFNHYTYTLETIIQAGQNNMAIGSVPIRVNGDLRPSRLVKSMPQYIQRSIITMLRIFIIYRPLAFFFTIATILFIIGGALGIRYLYYMYAGEGAGHIQSVIVCAILLGMAFQTFLIGFIADLQASNRKLLEHIRFTQEKNKDRNSNA